MALLFPVGGVQIRRAAARAEKSRHEAGFWRFDVAG